MMNSQEAAVVDAFGIKLVKRDGNSESIHGIGRFRGYCINQSINRSINYWRLREFILEKR